jgi:ABC-type uncharacterized transport system permease subunit
MNEKLHVVFSNPVYAVPIAAALNACFLMWQKSQLKKDRKQLDQSFIIRNSIFVGLLTFVIIYFGQNIGDQEEYLRVGPASF